MESNHPKFEARLLLGAAGLTMKHALLAKETLGSEEALLNSTVSDLLCARFSKAAAHRLIQCLETGEHQKEMEKAESFGARILFYGSPEYPEALEEIPDAPPVLFCLGETPKPKTPCVAMVGSRKCAPESERIAQKIGRDLGSLGICVVSGMARGIDSASIHGCLQGRGSPVGVLGCGINRVYPPENKDLFSRTRSKGALITEFPFDTPPQKKNFPRRNRIISGLSMGVLVVAASKRSGSLITVDHAIEQNRTVLAAPGPVGQASFEGSNGLIRDGASVVLESRDVLFALYLKEEKLKPMVFGEDPPPIGSPRLQQIVDACQFEALTVEGVAQKANMTVKEAMVFLSRLETEGWIKRVPGARFIGKDL